MISNFENSGRFFGHKNWIEQVRTQSGDVSVLSVISGFLERFSTGISHIMNMCVDWGGGLPVAKLSPEGHLTKTWFHDFHVII